MTALYLFNTLEYYMRAAAEVDQGPLVDNDNGTVPVAGGPLTPSPHTFHSHHGTKAPDLYTDPIGYL